MRPLVRALLAASMVLCAAPARAGTGGASIVVGHQGYVLNEQDAPLERAGATFGFRIYGAETGGTAEWQDASCTVEVRAGYYALTLGAGDCTGDGLDTADLPAGGGYLEVTLDGVTLEPRARLAPTPIATLALDAQKLAGKTLEELDLRYAQKSDSPSFSGTLSATSVTATTGDVAAAVDVTAARDVTAGRDVVAAAALRGASLSVTGDITTTGGKFIGDGSLLTNLPVPTGNEFPQGIKLGDPSPGSTTCTSGQAGTLRYTGSIEFCTGAAWVKLLAGVGTAQYMPGASCKAIKDAGMAGGDGYYWIDPNGGSTADAVQVFCDMTTDGGGWTALAANGENAADETSSASDCYPFLSDNTAGCGTPNNVLSDFSVPGAQQGALAWRHLLFVAYGAAGYTDKLAYFGIDFGASATTTEMRLNGTPYVPPAPFTTTYGKLHCTSSGNTAQIHYGKAGIYSAANASVAQGRGTVFGGNVVTNMTSVSAQIGFTDYAIHANGQVKGVDDYQDGGGCSDQWIPAAVRGARAMVLVR